MTANRGLETRSVPNARRLRRDITDVERLVCNVLRNQQLGVKFRRQHPIGPYIVDFLCEGRNLVVEIDGGQHSPEVDRVRTDYLISHGLQVLQIWNNDVSGNLEGVVTMIQNYLKGDAR